MSNPSATAGPRVSGRRRLLVWGERLLTLGLLAFVAVRLAPQLEALVGFAPHRQPAPAFTFVSLEGDTIHSADLAGKVVVVNFWATWCIPCRLEIPSLEKLHERHLGEGLVVLGFDTDRGDPAKVRAFVADHGLTYPVGVLAPSSGMAFGDVSAVPTTFVIDRSGMIRHKVVGYFAPPALGVEVSRLLKEPAPKH